MKINFGKLEPWQQDAFEQISKAKGTGQHFVIKSPRQVGKSHLIKIILSYYALAYPGSESCLISPVGYQSRRIMRSVARGLMKLGIIKNFNQIDGFIEFKNGSLIDFKSAEQKENLRGLTVSGVLIYDEAAYIQDEIFEITDPFGNVHKSPKVYVSTPLFESGRFFEEYSDPLNFVFDWSREVYDFSRFLSEEDLARYRKKYSANKFLTEILAEFIKEHSAVFGNFKECVGIPTDFIPVYGGLDFASGSGSDDTVLTLMNASRQVVDRIVLNDMEPNTQIEVLSKYINSHSTLKAVYCEMNSLGSVYYSVLRSKLVNKAVLREFETSNESKRIIIESLALAFQGGEITIDNDKKLHFQLSCFETKKLAKGYTYGNDSDTSHDDYVMSLAICYSAFSSGRCGSFGFSSKRR